jgi:hypothetical protein
VTTGKKIHLKEIVHFENSFLLKLSRSKDKQIQGSNSTEKTSSIMNQEAKSIINWIVFFVGLVDLFVKPPVESVFSNPKPNSYTTSSSNVKSDTNTAYKNAISQQEVQKRIDKMFGKTGEHGTQNTFKRKEATDQNQQGPSKKQKTNDAPAPKTIEKENRNEPRLSDIADDNLEFEPIQHNLHNRKQITDQNQPGPSKNQKTIDAPAPKTIEKENQNQQGLSDTADDNLEFEPIQQNSPKRKEKADQNQPGPSKKQKTNDASASNAVEKPVEETVNLAKAQKEFALKYNARVIMNQKIVKTMRAFREHRVKTIHAASLAYEACNSIRIKRNVGLNELIVKAFNAETFDKIITDSKVEAGVDSNLVIDQRMIIGNRLFVLPEKKLKKLGNTKVVKGKKLVIEEASGNKRVLRLRETLEPTKTRKYRRFRFTNNIDGITVNIYSYEEDKKSYKTITYARIENGVTRAIIYPRIQSFITPVQATERLSRKIPFLNQYTIGEFNEMYETPYPSAELEQLVFEKWPGQQPQQQPQPQQDIV